MRLEDFPLEDVELAATGPEAVALTLADRAGALAAGASEAGISIVGAAAIRADALPIFLAGATTLLEMPDARADGRGAAVVAGAVGAVAAGMRGLDASFTAVPPELPLGLNHSSSCWFVAMSTSSPSTT
jgi:hypothetical protein